MRIETSWLRYRVPRLSLPLRVHVQACVVRGLESVKCQKTRIHLRYNYTKQQHKVMRRQTLSESVWRRSVRGAKCEVSGFTPAKCEELTSALRARSWSWGTVRGERTWGGALREAQKPIFSLPHSDPPSHTHVRTIGDDAHRRDSFMEDYRVPASR